MTKTKKKRISGMTLSEVMVVILIIGILALISLAFFRKQIFKGNDAKRKGDLHNLQIAIEEYEKDNDCYPLPQLIVCDPGEGLKPYLSKIPCDPVTKASYYYDYENTSCPSWYKIYANLETETYGSFGPEGSFNYEVTSANAPPSEAPGAPSPPVPNFYGCFSGVCKEILWDEARPGPECDPNYQSATCYGQCANPENECQPWNN